MDADSTQKPLSVILDEIEERAKKAVYSHQHEDHKASFADVPALVKALRRTEQTFQFEINRGNDWSSLNARDALRDITAILNQGRS